MITPLALSGLWMWTPRRHEDARGWVSEVFSRRALLDVIGDLEFVQENHSASRARGVLRGLHVQAPPLAQDKLVRVVRGAVRDVSVDLRRRSAGYGRHQAVTLSAQKGEQIFVPKGFAHGFVTLEPDTEVVYKLSAPYSPAHEHCLLWNDAALAIDWGFPASALTLSERDRNGTPLAALPDLFA